MIVPITLIFTGILVSVLTLRLAARREPTPSDYTADTIFGIDWRWRYLAGKIDDEEFSPFCPQPRCKSRLEIRRRSAYSAIDSIALHCPHCGFTQDFDFDWSQLQRRAAIEVERRIRTGEFKKVLSQKA